MVDSVMEWVFYSVGSVQPKDRSASEVGLGGVILTFHCTNPLSLYLALRAGCILWISTHMLQLTFRHSTTGHATLRRRVDFVPQLTVQFSEMGLTPAYTSSH